MVYDHINVDGERFDIDHKNELIPTRSRSNRLQHSSDAGETNARPNRLADNNRRQQNRDAGETSVRQNSPDNSRQIRFRPAHSVPPNAY
ncbi:hypothetical protein ElyMa_002705700 [Elysia marginata]|uniref:Uncharacterized protein n=1 Tax=Elysia marginata TaxID=1093978 RepID=A0AAV4HG82_9GAST|nr:hypothetical protein ElyMa_002705700 [Elysia marginata]